MSLRQAFAFHCTGQSLPDPRNKRPLAAALSSVAHISLLKMTLQDDVHLLHASLFQSGILAFSIMWLPLEAIPNDRASILVFALCLFNCCRWGFAGLKLHALHPRISPEDLTILCLYTCASLIMIMQLVTLDDRAGFSIKTLAATLHTACASLRYCHIRELLRHQ